jgi:hypothetical protein
MSDHKIFSANSALQSTSELLLELGLPPLPVAPAFPAEQYPAKERNGELKRDKAGNLVPAFTGKNPSYIDSGGKPHLIYHHKYQNLLPSERELQEWFADERNGIGALGNEKFIWIDWDTKNFNSSEEFQQKYLEWKAAYPILNTTWQEQTQSQGYRLLVEVESKPNFTNFITSPGGKHYGEALGTGRFAVLAPTIGPSGNPYVTLYFGTPVKIPSLEAIGIFPVRKQSDKQQLAPQKVKVEGFETDQPSVVFFLENLCSERSQQILQGTCLTSDRSADLATAIQEWWGWSNWCQVNDIPILGSSEELAHRAGEKLGIDHDRVERILKTVNPTSCQPAAGYLGGEPACWKQVQKLNRKLFEQQCPAAIKTEIIHSARSGSSELPGATVNLKQIRQEIASAATQNFSEADLQQFKIELRLKTDLTGREIDRLFEAVTEESENRETQDDLQRQIQELLELGERSLALQDFLPQSLVAPLNNIAQWLNIRAEVCLTGVLAATSSLHKVGTKLTIRAAQAFTVSPNIFAALIAPSGQKKSPILYLLILLPLRELQREAKATYDRDHTRYEQELELWNQLQGEDRQNRFPEGKPREPSQKLFFFSDATKEGLTQQFNNHPNKGLLYVKDELPGIFKSVNAYRNGHGSDLEDILLSGFDGTGATVLRANGIRADLEGILLSIFGGVQPEVLKQHLKDCSDPDGRWSRFLFVHQPLAISKLHDEDSDFDPIELLAGFYKRVDQFPVMQYRFSRAAYKVYQDAYHRLEQLRVSAVEPGLRAVYAKMEGYIGRLAVNLHVLHEVEAGKVVPDVEISVERLKQAIKLANFFVGEVKLLHAESSSDRRHLAPHLLKLIDLSKRKAQTDSSGEGWIKAKDIQLGYDSKHRPSPNQVRQWMMETISLGYGRIRKSGIHLEYSHSKEISSTSPLLGGNQPLPSAESVDVFSTFTPLVEFAKSKVEETPPLESFDSQVSQAKVEKVEPLNIGDLCRYVGTTHSSLRMCSGKRLQVLELRSDQEILEARVKAETWAVAPWLPAEELEKI